jgi:glycosyltransferase involved in cell wall biosynthesis
MELKNLRVVQVVPVLAFGGLERVAVTLATRLAPRVGHMLVCTKGGDAFRGPLIEAGIPIEWIPRPRPRPDLQWAAARAIARVIRRERPHLIHAWNPGASLAASLARRLARRPDVAILASYQGVYAQSVGAAAGALRFSADLVVSLTPSSTKELREHGVPASRIVTIYNAVPGETRRTREDVRDEFSLNGSEVVVNVGRYAEEKNQALLVDAIAALAPRRPKLRALIVGEGDLDLELQQRIDEKGLSGRVTLTGPRKDAVDIVAASDVFALSSDAEALGVVLLEAMSVRCPVVAVGSGGVPDVVADGRTGLLVPARDELKLAGAIERVLDDRKLRDSLVENGADLVRTKFSINTMVNSFAAVYTSLVEAHRR